MVSHQGIIASLARVTVTAIYRVYFISAKCRQMLADYDRSSTASYIVVYKWANAC